MSQADGPTPEQQGQAAAFRLVAGSARRCVAVGGLRFAARISGLALTVIAIAALARAPDWSGIQAFVTGASRPHQTQPTADLEATGVQWTAVTQATAEAQEAIWPRWAPDPEASERVIGYSREGRPLVVYHLGLGPDPVLVLGGQHGAPEANTSRLAWQLLSHFEGSPDQIPSGLRLDIVPETNPDGLASGSRQFATGVDANRNWGGPDWASDAADSNGTFRNGLGGSEPFSEPETQALRDYVLATRPLLVVNYHSRGGFLFGGRTDRGNELADAYSVASGYYRPQPGAAGGNVLGYRATGSMNVWLAAQGLPGLLIELATSHDPEFARNLAGLQAVLEMIASE